MADSERGFIFDTVLASISGLHRIARLWITLQRYPSYAEDVIRTQNPMSPKAFYLSVLAFQSFLYLILFHEDPLSKLYVPEALRFYFELSKTVIPIGIPVLAAVSVGFFIAIPVLVTVILNRKAGIRLIADFGMLHGAIVTLTGFAVAAFVISLATVSVEAAFIIGVILVCIFAICEISWLHTQLRWIFDFGMILTLLLTTAIIVLQTYGAWLGSRYLLKTSMVDNWRMKPTLQVGDAVLVSLYDTYLREPEIGQIYVVCNNYGVCAMSRLVGVAGDEIKISNGALSINGTKVALLKVGQYKEMWGDKIIEWPLYLETFENGYSHFYTTMRTDYAVPHIFTEKETQALIWKADRDREREPSYKKGNQFFAR